MPDLSVLNIERVPAELPHRNSELQAIRNGVTGIDDQWRARPVRIYGPSGSGKTSVAIAAARKARDVLGVPFTVVDCITTHTRAGILHETASGLGMIGIHRGSTPPGLYHDYFRDEIDAGIVIIDEAGQIENLNVLQELLNSPTIAPVVIIHDEAKFMSRLEERIASRLRVGPAVHCDRYALDELVDILDSRLRAGELTHLIRDATLEVVADTAAGNARDAIALTQRLVEYARDHNTVATPDNVAELKEDATKRVVRHNLARLDTEHRVIYQIIYEAGEIRADELTTRINEKLDISSSARSRYLTALQGSYQVIEVDGENRWRTYRPIADVPARDPLQSP